MFNRLFTAHPKSVNETYTEHFVHAITFSIKLQMAAVVCFIHALVPGLFVKTGSRLITELHHKMVMFRVKKDADKKPLKWADESIEYMI